MGWELLVILILVLINGFLAGSEIAIVSLRKTRLRELVEEGSGAARAVETLRDNPERFLATVQIGITVVGATAGAFGGASIAADLEPYFARIPALASFAPELALGLVVVVVSYLSLVLGELVPKSLALRISERYALAVGRPLVWLSLLSRPLVWFLTASSNLVLRLFGDRTNFIEARLSPDELQQMLEEASKAGTLHPHAGEIAARALEFPELTAADVMIPRGDVVAIPKDATPEQLRRLILEEGHTRMPVYEGSIDRVVGYVNVKDLVALAWERELIVLADIVRPAWFVPEVKRAVDLLQEMRHRRTPFVIVVDESGGMAGIITLEDLVEELVGEIFSEREAPPPQGIQRCDDGTAVVQANLPVREVNRALDLDLPEEGDWTTLAGLCLALANRIPAVGERLETETGIGLEIVEASPRRVKRVRIIPPKPPEAQKDEPS